MRRILALFMFLCLLTATPASAQDLDLGGGADEGGDSILDEALGDLAADLGATDMGKTAVRLVDVAHPDETVDHYWRALPRVVAAKTFPVEIRLAGSVAIGGHDVALSDDRGMETVYEPTGVLELPMGKSTMQPGNITIRRAGAQLEADHPAIQVAGDELRIRCAAVRLEVVDDRGAPVPQRYNLGWNGQELLRSPGPYSVLTVWLPVGLSYQSSLGRFTLAADGTMTAEDLPEGVSQIAGGLRKTVPAAPNPAATSQPQQALVLWAHAARAVFTQAESMHLYVLAPKGFQGGDIALSVDGKPVTTIPFPAVDAARAWDSRGVVIDCAELAAGTHAITAEGGGLQSEALTVQVVSWQRRSPFLVQSMSCCTAPWPRTEAGLQILHDAGLEMLAATAHRSLLDGRRPTLGTPPSPGLPPELGWTKASNDLLLERLLTQRLRLIDLTVAREANFYNEGLSYHHSYQPSIDRMVRRLSIFAQQTGDYPSFWGANLGWFPKLGGYVEGGVATDAHTVDRNRVLDERLTAQGLSRLSRSDRRWLQEHAADDADPARVQSLIAQEIDWWKAYNQVGFGEHNARYAATVDLARPGTQTVLFDNAGHDHSNRARSQFHGLAAVAYESYTDYGEWPMSAAHSTDWGRASAPGQPVWLTADWGTSTEGMAKSMLHAFARGLAGGGVPMQETESADELRRRGRITALLSQYGSLSANMEPDNRVAILMTLSQRMVDPRAVYAGHALYYHLTRIGYPPIMVDAEDSVPATVRVLWLARQQAPLTAQERRLITDFQARGGTVMRTGDSSAADLPGVQAVGGDLLDIWRLSGFFPSAHQDMWQQFTEHWQAPLAAAMAATGVPRRVATDPLRAVAVTFDVGPLRYAVVVADTAGSHARDVAVVQSLPLSFDGEGWRVRDLTRQVDIPAESSEGRTVCTVDLITEPALLLALYRSAPVAPEMAIASSVATGDLRLRATAKAADGSDLGALPLRYTITDPAGSTEILYRAAGVTVDLHLPALSAAGEWTVAAQELIGGQSVSHSLTPPAATRPVATEAPPVEIPDPRAIREFAALEGERLIILEPGQRELLPMAERLRDALQAAGQPARIWLVKPEEMTGIPNRWYPRPEDQADLDAVAAGRLIGYRINMRPYINDDTRAHEPQRGGYATIEPGWMVGQHAILFSGGQLAESLRAVTNWLPTPSVPGAGRGRLVVCFSPFMADRHVVVVAANDPTGLALAADRLASAMTETTTQPMAAAAPSWQPATGKQTQETVPTPMAKMRIWDRVQGLASAPQGITLLHLDSTADSVATIGDDGQIRQQASVAAASVMLSDSGAIWTVSTTDADMVLGRLGPDGDWDRRLTRPRPRGTIPRDRLTGGLASYQIAPDGRTVIVPEFGGAWLGDLESGDWRFYDDIPRAWLRPEVWSPRFPVAVTFSPDGHYVFMTMEARPTGHTNMSGIAFTPTGTETVLVDTRTATCVWSRRDAPDAADALIGGQPGTSSALTNLRYATHGGFAAVARDGVATAFADFGGDCWLIDRDGKTIMHHRPADAPTTVPQSRYSEIGPPDGVGVAIADTGALAAWAFRDRVVLGNGQAQHEVALAQVFDIAVTRAGGLAVVALRDGTVVALAADGGERWRYPSGGSSPRVAAAGATDVIVAHHDGRLTWLNSDGSERWTTDVASALDAETHSPGAPPAEALLAGPVDYREPQTLAVAKATLAATQRASWQPSGAASTIAGRAFHRVEGKLDLAATDAPSAFLHLVYRVESQGDITVTTTGGGLTEHFILDLPTPAYRVVDIPITGPDVSVSITASGPWAVAECSLWAYTLPGTNFAILKTESMASGVDSLDGGGNDLGGLELEATTDGAVKDVTLYTWNPDPDKVLGDYMAPGTGPLKVVDGLAFGSKPLPPWGFGQDLIGPWFILSLPRPTAGALVMTYDNATRQSAVCQSISVFTGFDPAGNRDAGRVLNAVIENDQFWRLLPIDPTPRLQIGVHLSGPRAGLREVELYPAPRP